MLQFTRKTQPGKRIVITNGGPRSADSLIRSNQNLPYHNKRHLLTFCQGYPKYYEKKDRYQKEK